MQTGISAVEEPLTRRARILAHLAEHPDLTVYEICRALGYLDQVGRGGTGAALQLLRTMERQALVVARTEYRAQQGRHVYLWRVAPPGTTPPPAPSRTARQPRRERDRVSRRREAQVSKRVGPPEVGVSTTRPKLPVAATWTLPAGAACQDADPALFFPEPGGSDQASKVICAGCPVRAECLAAALANGERYGVWGGVNLETREHCTDGAR